MTKIKQNSTILSPALHELYFQFHNDRNSLKIFEFPIWPLNIDIELCFVTDMISWLVLLKMFNVEEKN